MALEIERKFLVVNDGWRVGDGMYCLQGYLCIAPERTVRVRIAGGSAFLTVKGASRGATRDEFEYRIPLDDAQPLLDLCIQPLIEKTRYLVPDDELVWEIDEFHGENDGLVIAEIELTSEDQEFARPQWLGAEITGDPKYYNANLVKHPFARW